MLSVRLGVIRSRLLHLRPLSRLRRGQHGVDDVIRGEAVLEVRRAALAAFEALDELDHRVDEAVLVAELEAGDPPLAAVGMVAVGDMDTLPAALLALVAVVEDLQAVEIVQVP